MSWLKRRHSELHEKIRAAAPSLNDRIQAFVAAVPAARKLSSIAVQLSPVKTHLERLRLYLDRLERDLAAHDRTQALADCAELAELARRLWSTLARPGNG